MNKKVIEEMRRIALSMFRKSFFGVFHGSLSVKVGESRFIINKKEAIFDELDDSTLMMLRYDRDYRWHEASLDSAIHASIYQGISDAKCIAYCLPPFTMAYALRFNKIIPQDYFGARILKSIEVYNPKDFETWYERADVEIVRHMRESNARVMVIRGYGVYLFERDMNQLAKMVALVENSCKILHLSALLDNTRGVQSCDLPLYQI